MLCTLSKKARIPAAYVSYLFGVFSRAMSKEARKFVATHTHKRVNRKKAVLEKKAKKVTEACYVGLGAG